MSRPSASSRRPRSGRRLGRSRTTRQSLGERKLVIGVDRLDYSKGIVQRLEAFGQFLRSHPEHRGRVGMLQIAPPSRSDVPEYAELDRQSDETAGRLNAALGEFDWTPIRVVKKAYSRKRWRGSIDVRRSGW
jgi:trehalose 6-phosphate synthase